VLLKWNIQRGVVVIPKASSEAHLKENISGCFDWKLSNDHKVSLSYLILSKWWPNFEGAFQIKQFM